MAFWYGLLVRPSGTGGVSPHFEGDTAAGSTHPTGMHSCSVM